ncbi:ParB/RepB/Spo0J family partition protein [Streptomyces sp. BA2]|uniref:ParB/RepB/Spo0J family partition protein n=1 Tax=Streptomyces sp. BA2 TaxID=436595 RepID=UPI001321AD74|nr:ParB/RepB/Spo0J family partition protein [Streptomyces sp. BA2]MWA07897.1 ParB/RepB/Spo0J family partition protein [Streptomyces sp. BA2]
MSRVADQLGTGASFGRTRGGVSARRAAVAAATGGVPTEGVPDPTTLSVDLISPNPDNPRTTFGDLTDLGNSLRDHGQKQAVTVMNRDAYVTANPARESELEDGTTHVVVDGSSRLWAARECGVPELKVMVDDTQGSTEDELLESALVANVHRQDLEPMDEARALQRLLTIHKTQTKLAKRLHRSQGWVSQRLALLGLTPELQQSLEAGTESVDLLRAVGNKPAERQQEALEELKEKKAAEESTRRRERGTPRTNDESHYDVIEDGTGGAGKPDPQGAQHRAPEASLSADDEPTVRREYTAPATAAAAKNSPAQKQREPLPELIGISSMPFGRPEAVLRILEEHMPAEKLEQLIKLLNNRA